MFACSGDYVLDPSVKQFGNYHEFSIGAHPLQDEMAGVSVSDYLAPAADLAELDNFALYMADESVKAGNYPDGWQCKASNAAHEYAKSCRAVILRNIEEAK